jgi:hypothetical protein
MWGSLSWATRKGVDTRRSVVHAEVSRCVGVQE